jgi:hypothetical protein
MLLSFQKALPHILEKLIARGLKICLFHTQIIICEMKTNRSKIIEADYNNFQANYHNLIICSHADYWIIACIV